MNKETVGKVSRDLQLKSDHNRLISPVELEKGMQEDYLKNLADCVDATCKTLTGDFYVVVLTKRERLMENVLRNYFFGRQTCPTPEYDQSVFKYHHESGSLSYLWTIPSKDTCFHLKQHALEVVNVEADLLRFVLEFGDGTLDKLAKKLNGEQPDSPLLLV